MKQLIKKRLVLVVGMIFLLSSFAMAQGWGQKGNRGPQFAGQQQGFGPGQVLREQMYNARVEVLDELSELTAAEIEAKLQYKPLWAVIDEAKVDFPTFQTKLHDKRKDIIGQAVTDGKLTKEQGDFMLERMANGPGKGGRGFGRGRGHGPGFGRGFCGGNR